jgi:integrase
VSTRCRCRNVKHVPECHKPESWWTNIASTGTWRSFRVSRQEMVVIDETRIDLLATAIDPRFRAAVYVGCYAGLRAGELFGLKWRNVDFSRRTATITQTVIETGGKLLLDQPPKSAAGRRTVPLATIALDALRDRMDTQPGNPDDYVFTDSKGGPVRLNNFRKRQWRKAVAAAGIAPEFRVHDQRHTAVSLWIKYGISAKEVSVRAGHTSVAFTLDRYGHLYPANDEAFIDALDLGTRSALIVQQAVAK